MTVSPEREQELRQQIRQAIAEAEQTDFDALEPHDYQQHADVVLPIVRAAVAAERARALNEAADALAALTGYPGLVLPEEMVAELRRMAAAPAAGRCTCEPTQSQYDGPSGPAEGCPIYGNPDIIGAPLREQHKDALAPMFEGLERLISTSSRDWGEYRVDAWLWAVLVGWDCEDAHEHDEACDDGAAMAEIVERHGWDEEAVAKARRYRAAVRAISEQGKVTRVVADGSGGPEHIDDCPGCAAFSLTGHVWEGVAE